MSIISKRALVRSGIQSTNSQHFFFVVWSTVWFDWARLVIPDLFVSSMAHGLLSGLAWHRNFAGEVHPKVR